MCEKDWKIDSSEIEFDYPYEEARYRHEKTVELVMQTIDKITYANDIDLYELPILYTDIIKVLLNRIQGDLEIIKGECLAE